MRAAGAGRVLSGSASGGAGRANGLLDVLDGGSIARVDESRVEVDVHDAAVAGDGAELIVGQVARHVAERAGAGVRCDHRHGGDGDRVVEGAVRDVRQIDEHAEPVHLAHDVSTERGEAAGARIAGADRRASPCVAVVPRQREVARSSRVEIAQAIERALDRMAALHADEDRDLPFRLRAAHVGGGGGEEEAVRMPVDEGVDHLDVLERAGERRAGVLRVGRIDPRRHELRGHPGFDESREVGVALRRAEAGRMTDVGIVAVLEDPGGHVVVRVDHVRLAIHAERAGRDFGDAHRARRRRAWRREVRAHRRPSRRRRRRGRMRVMVGMWSAGRTREWERRTDRRARRNGAATLPRA